jgi:hypothetical protein
MCLRPIDLTTSPGLARKLTLLLVLVVIDLDSLSGMITLTLASLLLPIAGVLLNPILESTERIRRPFDLHFRILHLSLSWTLTAS